MKHRAKKAGTGFSQQTMRFHKPGASCEKVGTGFSRQTMRFAHIAGIDHDDVGLTQSAVIVIKAARQIA
jgi:hypothetical protein